MNNKKAYVIGSNVSTSLSPTIFKYWFDKYNINAEYGYKEIKKENFDKNIKTILNEEGLCGLNVTIPFKETIKPYLNEIFVDEFIKPNDLPINCVTVVENKKLFGTNTDWIGFNNSYIDFEKTKGQNRQRSAIVIGYGGAAKAIIFTLKQMGFKKIKVFNRTFDKFIQTNPNIKKLHKEENIKHNTIETYKIDELSKHINYKKNTKDEIGLIVNTTPKNILGNSKKWNIGPNTWGFDIVYRPRGGTGFLKHFEPQNRIEGIQMLVYQAAPCFNMWFGKNPKIDEGLFKALYKKMEIK